MNEAEVAQGRLIFGIVDDASALEEKCEHDGEECLFADGYDDDRRDLVCKYADYYEQDCAKGSASDSFGSGKEKAGHNGDEYTVGKHSIQTEERANIRSQVPDCCASDCNGVRNSTKGTEGFSQASIRWEQAERIIRPTARFQNADQPRQKSLNLSALLFFRCGWLQRKTRHTHRFAPRFLVLINSTLYSFKQFPVKKAFSISSFESACLPVWSASYAGNKKDNFLNEHTPGFSKTHAEFSEYMNFSAKSNPRLGNKLSCATDPDVCKAKTTIPPGVLVTDYAICELFDFSLATCAWEIVGAAVEGFCLDKQQNALRWKIRAVNILLLDMRMEEERRKQKTRAKVGNSKDQPYTLYNSSTTRSRWKHGQSSVCGNDGFENSGALSKSTNFLSADDSKIEPSSNSISSDCSAQPSDDDNFSASIAKSSALRSSCVEEVTFLCRDACRALDWLQLLYSCSFLGSCKHVYAHASHLNPYPSCAIDSFPFWLYIPAYLQRYADAATEVSLYKFDDGKYSYNPNKESLIESISHKMVPLISQISGVDSSCGRRVVYIRLLELREATLPVSSVIWGFIEHQSNNYPIVIHTCYSSNGSTDRKNLLQCNDASTSTSASGGGSSLFSKWFGRGQITPSVIFCRKTVYVEPEKVVMLPVFFPRLQEDILFHLLATPLTSALADEMTRRNRQQRDITHDADMASKGQTLPDRHGSPMTSLHYGNDFYIGSYRLKQQQLGLREPRRVLLEPCSFNYGKHPLLENAKHLPTGAGAGASILTDDRALCSTSPDAVPSQEVGDGKSSVHSTSDFSKWNCNGMLLIDSWSPGNWVSFLGTEKEAFDSPQPSNPLNINLPFVPADRGTLTPIHLLMLQLRRLSTLRKQWNVFCEELAVLTEFKTASVSFFAMFYLIFATLLPPQYAVVLLSLPVLVFLFMMHPMAIPKLIAAVAETPLLLLFLPRRLLTELLLLDPVVAAKVTATANDSKRQSQFISDEYAHEDCPQENAAAIAAILLLLHQHIHLRRPMHDVVRGTEGEQGQTLVEATKSGTEDTQQCGRSTYEKENTGFNVNSKGAHEVVQGKQVLASSQKNIHRISGQSARQTDLSTISKQLKSDTNGKEYVWCFCALCHPDILRQKFVMDGSCVGIQDEQGGFVERCIYWFVYAFRRFILLMILSAFGGAPRGISLLFLQKSSSTCCCSLNYSKGKFQFEVQQGQLFALRNSKIGFDGVFDKCNQSHHISSQACHKLPKPSSTLTAAANAVASAVTQSTRPGACLYEVQSRDAKGQFRYSCFFQMDAPADLLQYLQHGNAFLRSGEYDVKEDNVITYNSHISDNRRPETADSMDQDAAEDSQCYTDNSPTSPMPDSAGAFVGFIGSDFAMEESGVVDAAAAAAAAAEGMGVWVSPLTDSRGWMYSISLSGPWASSNQVDTGVRRRAWSHQRKEDIHLDRMNAQCEQRNYSGKTAVNMKHEVEYKTTVDPLVQCTGRRSLTPSDGRKFSTRFTPDTKSYLGEMAKIATNWIGKKLHHKGHGISSGSKQRSSSQTRRGCQADIMQNVPPSAPAIPQTSVYSSSNELNTSLLTLNDFLIQSNYFAVANGKNIQCNTLVGDENSLNPSPIFPVGLDGSTEHTGRRDNLGRVGIMEREEYLISENASDSNEEECGVGEKFVKGVSRINPLASNHIISKSNISESMEDGFISEAGCLVAQAAALGNELYDTQAKGSDRGSLGELGKADLPEENGSSACRDETEGTEKPESLEAVDVKRCLDVLNGEKDVLMHIQKEMKGDSVGIAQKNDLSSGGCNDASVLDGKPDIIMINQSITRIENPSNVEGERSALKFVEQPLLYDSVNAMEYEAERKPFKVKGLLKAEHGLRSGNECKVHSFVVQQVVLPTSVVPVEDRKCDDAAVDGLEKAASFWSYLQLSEPAGLYTALASISPADGITGGVPQLLPGEEILQQSCGLRDQDRTKSLWSPEVDRGLSSHNSLDNVFSMMPSGHREPFRADRLEILNYPMSACRSVVASGQQHSPSDQHKATSIIPPIPEVVVNQEKELLKEIIKPKCRWNFLDFCMQKIYFTARVNRPSCSVNNGCWSRLCFGMRSLNFEDELSDFKSLRTRPTVIDALHHSIILRNLDICREETENVEEWVIDGNPGSCIVASFLRRLCWATCPLQTLKERRELLIPCSACRHSSIIGSSMTHGNPSIVTFMHDKSNSNFYAADPADESSICITDQLMPLSGNTPNLVTRFPSESDDLAGNPVGCPKVSGLKPNSVLKQGKGSGKIPGPFGVFLAYKEAREAFMRLLTLVWFAAVYLEKGFNLVSWKNRNVTLILANLLICILLAILFVVPVQVFLILFISDAFYVGHKRGQWKKFVKNALRVHLDRAVADALGFPCTYFELRLLYEEHRQYQLYMQQKPKPIQDEGQKHRLVVLEKKWQRLMMHLQLCVQRRCGFEIPSDIFVNSIDEETLLERLLRVSPFYNKVLNQRPWWLLCLLGHSPTDINHDGGSVTIL